MRVLLSTIGSRGSSTRSNPTWLSVPEAIAAAVRHDGALAAAQRLIAS
jgi:hypothetical protein